jgi:glycosyltransferase involved in cell wall biosynthesis
MNLSIIVITNKEKLDKHFLELLSFGDELIIEYSKTLESFAEKRNKALAKAKGDWVLFVDDDEIVSRQLADEIKEVIKTSKFNGFKLKRRDIVFNEELKHGEVGKIKILRLAKRKAGKFERRVHEVWKIKSKTKTLKNPLYHIKDCFVSEFIGRMSFYGPLDAASLNSENKNFSYLKLLFYPLGKFLNNYFFNQGFKDGFVGLFLAYLMSVQSLTVRVFQNELNETK